MHVRLILLITLVTALLIVPSGWGQAGPKQQTPLDRPLYTVLNPTGDPPAIERKPLSPRPSDLTGRTIYLVDITFNNGDVLLAQMQSWLARNRPDIKSVIKIKKGAYAADDPELWQEIQSSGGLMVMAIGH